MGRASTGGGGRYSSSARSSRSSSPAPPTSEFDPAYPPNLKRSLSRNDVELAALSKLHVALRRLKETIVEEYGECALLEGVVDEKNKLPSGGETKSKDEKVEEEDKKLETGEDDEATPKEDGDNSNKEKAIRLKKLLGAFNIRMTLRRRLLNRLARRLHRVAHIMDGTSNSSSISAPMPPLYGDVQWRYISEENEKSGILSKMMGVNLDNVRVVRQKDLKEFVDREKEVGRIRDELDEQRSKRRLMMTSGEEGGEDKEESGDAQEEGGDKQEGEVDEGASDEEKAEPESMDVDEDSTKKDKVSSDEKVEEEERSKEPVSSEVDLLLRGDEEDKPLLEQLAQYEPGYDKVYSIGPLPPLPPPNVSSAEVSSPVKEGLPAKPKAEETSDAKMADADEQDEVNKSDENENSSDADEMSDDAKEGKEKEAPASPTVDDIETSSTEATPEETKEASSTTIKGDTEDKENETTSTTPGEKQVLKTTKPIANTTDDHEVDDNGDYVSDIYTEAPSRRMFSIHPAALNRVLHPKERSEEWKRWTKEICDKIPDQITFDELGVGGAGVVFDLEGRLKRKRDESEEHEVEESQKEEAVANRGKGKVLRKKSSPEKAEKKLDSDDDAEDVKMDDADESKPEAKPDENEETSPKEVNEKKTDKAAAMKDLPKKPTKSFSVTPVPSFYYQDLKRIRIVQNDISEFHRMVTVRKAVFQAQMKYDASYSRSMQLQQAKANAQKTYKNLIDEQRRQVAQLEYQAKLQLATARSHWERRRAQKMDMQSKLGAEGAFVREVNNDILQELKDRVAIRSADELKKEGLGTHNLNREVLKAQKDGDINKEVAGTMLGHMIDSVERRSQDSDSTSDVFVPPPVMSVDTVIGDPKTGETLAQVHKRRIEEIKREIQQLDIKFREAEAKRGQDWMSLNAAKGGRQQQPSRGASKPKQSKSRARHSTGSTGARAVVSMAASNASLPSNRRQQPVGYPTQMQNAQMMRQQGGMSRSTQPSAPGSGYIPASYYPGTNQQRQVTNAGMSAAQVMAYEQMQNTAHMRNAQLQNVQMQSAQAHLAASAGFPASSMSGAQNLAVLMAQQQGRSGYSAGPSMAHPANRAAAAGGITIVPSGASNLNQGVQHNTGVTAAQLVAAAAVNQQTTAAAAQFPDPNQKGGSLAKYAYGDRYSAANVNARKNHDGTVVPVTAPKLLPDGTFARPAGRQRKGMDWDPIKGVWFPDPNYRPDEYTGY